MSDLRDKYTNMEDHVLAALKDELETKRDLEDGHGKNNFVMNTQTLVHHKVRVAQEAPLFWRARRGWKCGVALFCWTPDYPRDNPDRLCDTCFFCERIGLTCQAQQAALANLVAS